VEQEVVAARLDRLRGELGDGLVRPLLGAVPEARGQHLQVELPETLPLVGDRDLLLQAVANLLDNALKFTPEGGTVRLAAQGVVAEGSTVQGSAAPGLVAVAVSDDGPGMPEGDRGRAGERFFRADAARSTPGSGLGLSLVRAVAALHGGEVLLSDTHPGAAQPGLTVCLRLPGA